MVRSLSRRRWTSLLVLASVAALAVPANAGAARPDDALRQDFQTKATAGLERLLDEMAGHKGNISGRRYVDGTWLGDPGCWWCSIAPVLPAAVLARLQGPTSRWLPIAKETVQETIRRYQQADGSFATSPADAQFGTFVTGQYLAGAYLELEPYLSPRRRASWRRSIDRAARWLVPRLSYYVNGNVNLGETTFVDLAWRVTGDRSLARAYRRSLRFTLAPGGGHPGYGLTYLDRPRRADGADGAAFLAEGLVGVAPGFDTNYTLVQDDHAAMLYAFSRAPEARRLLNLLTNTLVRRADPHTWLIEAVNGSRHPNTSSVVRYESPGLAMAALAAGRRDLRPRVMNHLVQCLRGFHALLSQGPGHQDSVSEYATALIALQPRRDVSGHRR
jgi:hypothetical protein